MTRFELLSHANQAELQAMANAFAAQVEGQGYAVKSSQYAIHPSHGLYTVMIVYGNGPATTHVFPRTMRE
jgi:hypothetical protein